MKIDSKNITPEMINDLKLKYGVLKIVTVVVEEAELDKKGNEITPAEQYQFLVRRPDRGLVKMLTALGEKKQYDEFNDKAIKNLVVGGDMEALNDGIVYMGVVAQLQPLLQPVKSFLSKA